MTLIRLIPSWNTDLSVPVTRTAAHPNQPHQKSRHPPTACIVSTSSIHPHPSSPLCHTLRSFRDPLLTAPDAGRLQRLDHGSSESAPRSGAAAAREQGRHQSGRSGTAIVPVHLSFQSALASLPLSIRVSCLLPCLGSHLAWLLPFPWYEMQNKIT
jgi:hypothetical protein